MMEAVMNIQHKYHVIILMAGKSSRFGQPKAFLPFDENHNFIQNLLHQYIEAGINQIVLVTNTLLVNELEMNLPGNLPKEKIKIIVNPDIESNRFYSLKLALQNMELSYPVFIQNIDNPFTSSDLINEMKGKIQENQYVAPGYQGKRGHPILLSKEILKFIIEFDSVNENLRDLLEDFICEEVPTDDTRLMANINTREEYVKYFNHELPV